MTPLTHIDQLEAEAIYIIREVAAECRKPVMLYSIGTDGSPMTYNRENTLNEKGFFAVNRAENIWLHNQGQEK